MEVQAQTNEDVVEQKDGEREEDDAKENDEEGREGGDVTENKDRKNWKDLIYKFIYLYSTVTS